MSKKRMFLMDLPMVQFPWKKPEKNELWRYNKFKIFRPSTVHRFEFLSKYYAMPLLRAGFVFCGSVYLLFGFARALPPWHNFEIKRAYDARRERHLKYLEENPKYEQALLTAYKSLGPQN